jgi:hypothetical protein
VAERRRHLDEPYLTQRLALEQARAALRQLAQDPALPRAMRNSCARMFRRLGEFAETLRREAEERRRQAP